MAYTGKGNSILSCGQFEHYKIKVDDRSIVVGGSQTMSTPDGQYVFLLTFENGLPILKL
jgi:hypothetical protein